jgi:DNA-binding transcriptional regulator YdaS (Cro superfamily)
MSQLHPIDRATKHLNTSLEGLGAMLGVSKGAVFQWKSESRNVPVEHCVVIERATDGEVTRQDLRPDDYWLIWPDLQSPADIAQGVANV